MSNIKYQDYLLMHYSRNDKNNNTSIVNELSVSFLDYFKYLLDADFKPFEEYLLAGIELHKFSNRNEDHIIEGMLAVTDKDLSKKVNDTKKNYYICNAICALNTVKRIYTNKLYDDLTRTDTPDIALHNYWHILRYILLDTSQLINQYNIYLKDNHEYAATTNRVIHSMSLHQILRQSLYGQVSLHSFADVEIDASIAVIQQIIELRIRRAFGILGLIDNNENVKPLDLSAIFDSLRKHISYIEFPIKLESLERIYKWSNMYIHCGQGGFSWQPYFIESFLKEFSLGKEENGSWAYNNAIKIKKEALEKIYADLLANKTDWKVYGCRQECIIIE